MTIKSKVQSTRPLPGPPAIMPIVIVGGDKGGIGKSFTARSIAAWLRRKGYAVSGFDGDARNAHLERFYGSTMQISRPYLREATGWDEMLNGWQTVDPGAVILVDTPAGLGDMIQRESARMSAVAAALGRFIIHVWVSDEEDDSIILFKLLQTLTDPSLTIYALNSRFGARAADFELWSNSEERREHLAAGGYETLIPVLRIGARIKIRQARCGFDDVATAGLSIVEKVDLDLWWSKLDQAVKPLAEMLLGGRP